MFEHQFQLIYTFDTRFESFEPERTQLSEPARTLMIAFNLEEL